MSRNAGAALLLVAAFAVNASAVERWRVRHFAGTTGGAGAIDGPGATARLSQPYGVAADTAGNLFIADTNNSVLRKITQAGVVSTIAGVAGEWGLVDGDRANARLDYPIDLVVSPSGDIYFLDRNTVRRASQTGTVITIAGSPIERGYADGDGSQARFRDPWGLVLDSSGNLYVADRGNNVIRKVTPGGFVTTIAGIRGQGGYANGGPGVGTLGFITGITLAGGGMLYAADSGNHLIRVIDPASGFISTLAGSPFAVTSSDGTGAAGTFLEPVRITSDGALLYVADSSDHRVRKVSLTGQVTTVTGTTEGYADGAEGVARFAHPYGIAAVQGSLYVTDVGNNAVRRIAADKTTSTVAGVPAVSGYVDGAGDAARFDVPWGVAFDREGNAFVVEGDGVGIRKISRSGMVTTFAPFEDSNGGIAVNSHGEVFISDLHRIVRYTAGGIASTFAGDRLVAGGTDGTGAAARFNYPRGLAFDAEDNLYVTDYSGYTVRKITPAGVVTTIAGTYLQRGSVDGIGAAARFNFPIDLVLDKQHNIYVADQTQIRRIASDGTVTTVAGIAGGTAASLDGPAATARFRSLSAIEVGGDGSIYVVDSLAYNIRRVAGGEVTTVSGRDRNPGSRNGVGTESRFFGPRAFAIDIDGNIVICDTQNHALRRSRIPRRRAVEREEE